MNSSNLDTYTWSFELIVGSSQLLGLRSRLSKLIKSSSPYHFFFLIWKLKWGKNNWAFGLELGRALKILISFFFFSWIINYPRISYHHIPATIKQKYCTNSTVNEYSFFPSGGQSESHAHELHSQFKSNGRFQFIFPISLPKS